MVKHIDYEADQLNERQKGRLALVQTTLGIPNDGDDEDIVQWKKPLSWVGYLVTLFDITNFVFDVVFVVGLLNKGYTRNAIYIIIGLAVSLFMQFLGRKRLREGGLKPGPFFIKFDDYFEKMPFRRAVLPLIFAITYTEMASFFFEDGAFLAAFVMTSEIRENLNVYEKLSLRLTVAKAAISGSLAIIALMSSFNWGCCGSGTTFRSHMVMIRKVFLYVMVWSFVASMWTEGMRIAVKILLIDGDAKDADLASTTSIAQDNADFDVAVFMFWLPGLYFVISILRNGAKPTDDAVDKNKSYTAKNMEMHKDNDAENPIADDTWSVEEQPMSVPVKSRAAPVKTRAVPVKTRAVVTKHPMADDKSVGSEGSEIDC